MAFKTFLLVLISFYFYNVAFAQENIFVRLYNSSNQKIAKGKLRQSTDSIIVILQKRHLQSIPVSEVATLKTKHSQGHDILMGTTIGAGAGIIAILIGAATYNSSDGSGTINPITLIAGGVLLPIVGTGAGTVSALIKKSETYNIDGNTEKWKVIRAKFSF